MFEYGLWPPPPPAHQVNKRKTHKQEAWCQPQLPSKDATPAVFGRSDPLHPPPPPSLIRKLPRKRSDAANHNRHQRMLLQLCLVNQTPCVPPPPTPVTAAEACNWTVMHRCVDMWKKKPCACKTHYSSFTITFKLHRHIERNVLNLDPGSKVRVNFLKECLTLQSPCYSNTDMSFSGVYTAEPLLDFSWSRVSLGLLYVYHFIPLQYLAYVSNTVYTLYITFKVQLTKDF